MISGAFGRYIVDNESELDSVVKFEGCECNVKPSGSYGLRFFKYFDGQWNEINDGRSRLESKITVGDVEPVDPQLHDVWIH